jgi:hypothetical protein
LVQALLHDGAAAAVDGFCVTIISKTKTVDLEARTANLLAAWLFGINSVLLAKGRACVGVRGEFICVLALLETVLLMSPCFRAAVVTESKSEETKAGSAGSTAAVETKRVGEQASAGEGLFCCAGPTLVTQSSFTAQLPFPRSLR